MDRLPVRILQQTAKSAPISAVSTPGYAAANGHLAAQVSIVLCSVFRRLFHRAVPPPWVSRLIGPHIAIEVLNTARLNITVGIAPVPLLLHFQLLLPWCCAFNAAAAAAVE
jgi:hypothetical protein